jgi:DNA-binding NtrC family response regulator
MTDIFPAQSPAKPSVLIVDDEQPFLDMLDEAFADEFELITLASAEEAEQMMAMRRFDVVVCDHLMPGEAGLDFLTRCSARWPRTRRILLTGYINPELLSRSIAIADLAECLLKPVRPAELAKVIRATLKHE